MATVTVQINGRPHQVGCAEGQEARVAALAERFDQLVRQVAGDVGQVGDMRLFLMAGLLLADENQDLKAAPAPPTGAATQGDADAAEAAAAILETAAARIEAVARSL